MIWRWLIFIVGITAASASALHLVDNTEYGNWKLSGTLVYQKLNARHNSYFAGKSFSELQGMMGVDIEMERKHWATLPLQKTERASTYLPPQFIAGKDKWQKCDSTINFIKDQTACGGCWAISASSVMADRICIANYDAIPSHSLQEVYGLNEQKPLIDMSVNQILACNTEGGFGCKGGAPSGAFKFWQDHGVVTGGWYGSKCGCQPYTITWGVHSGQAPACTNVCESGYGTAYQDDKHFAEKAYRISWRKGAEKMQEEIYENGPIACIFKVFENLHNYKNGIYDQTSGRLQGWHGVKIIGWGEDNGIPYWLINNSWNSTWGDKGQLKMLRGKNLASIESGCSTGKAKAADSNFQLKCY